MPPPGWKRPANRPIPPPTRAMSSATPVSASSPSNPTFPAACVMGGPKQAIERIRVLRDVGITQIGMLVDFGSLPQAEIMRSLEIFAERGAAARARPVTRRLLKADRRVGFVRHRSSLRTLW